MKYVYFILFIAFSCGPQSSSKSNSLYDSSSPTNQNQQSIIADYNSKACNLGLLSLPISLGTPNTFNQIVDLINALPKPVTIPCFLQALVRPLKVNATSSTLSVQPAAGLSNPRVFIIIDKLYISFSSAGDGKDLLEFSYMYTSTSSLKGELTFPIQNNISYESPFIGINTGGRTSCSGCHINELKDNSITHSGAFVSQSLKPDPKNIINLNSFSQQNYLCKYNNDLTYRCQIIRSLFENGTLIQVNFPSDTPTYFQSLGF